jgi:indolepyruvate ferredoxin oxidoreductase
MDAQFAREFADGLETILVIEEKRSFLELHLRDALYAQAQRPQVLGKIDANGAMLLPPSGELDADKIAKVVGRLLSSRSPSERVTARMKLIDGVVGRPRELSPIRASNFCSGCPHNRSTLLLEGQVAGGGIGCHTMAMRLVDSGRAFSFLTHMGGEGAPWIGMAPFVGHEHIFQNIGDGTFFHSGSLAVQALVASGLNITYKILYNGHVAMTGGQAAQGALPIPKLTKKLEAEGLRKIIILAEDVKRYEGVELAAIAEVRDRSALEKTLADLAKEKGVTAMIYDQECVV